MNWERDEMSYVEMTRDEVSGHVFHRWLVPRLASSAIAHVH